MVKLRKFMLIPAVALSGWVANAAVSAPTEYEVKAAFLYNFAYFINWPPQAFPQADAPFVLGILGDDPFGQSLNRIVEGEMIGGRPIQVVRSRRLKDIGNCQILFISRSEKASVRAILAALADAPTLTVGETEDFARSGGIVTFVVEESKVRFGISVEAAERAHLKISSKLLSLSRDVSGTGTR
jgi:hypothetical protein